MKFESTISTAVETHEAVAAVCAAVEDMTPDLALLFASHHHGPDFSEMLQEVRDGTNARNLIGCTGDSIIGPDCEIERAPAVALWAAQMPGVRILPFVIDQQDIQQFNGPADWHERTGVVPDQSPGFIVLPEPFSIDIGECLRQMDHAFSGAAIVGGMASGGTAPDQNRLFLNDQVIRQGMVGVSLSGPVEIRAITSQGCRPIGKPYVVTKASENVIFEVGGRPVLEVLKSLFDAAEPSDRSLMQTGLHVGCVVDETLRTFGPGDFLVRNVLGVVDNRGLAVTDYISPGQTIKFHVRDARAADEEMEELLAANVADMGSSPAGGLLFTCNGRGTRMFGIANHDVALVNRVLTECPVAGFFAQGEIGPVGRRTFIHGFTSTLILFRAKQVSG